MLRKTPHFGRLASKLAFQLAPAVFVSAAGIALLGSLAKAPDPAPVAAPAATVIQAEAVFKIVPRQTADAETDRASDPDAGRAKATATRAAKPKTAAANPSAQQPRKVAVAEPAIAAPAEPPAAQPASPPDAPAASTPAAPSGGNFIATGWQRVTAAAERLSQWVQPPSAWFERSPPPRPPAPIPERNFVGVSL